MGTFIGERPYTRSRSRSEAGSKTLVHTVSSLFLFPAQFWPRFAGRVQRRI